MTDVAEAPHPEPARAAPRGRPPVWLFTAVLVSAIAVTVVSELRYEALLGTTWDLGIYQQALWSGAHGGHFYEAADYETGGFGSFLQVHSAFVLYLLAPAYGAWPDPLLLYAVQAAVVALAAVPLYYLGLSRGASSRRALGLAVLYLAWAPAIDGALHDFHIEAFVPLTYLSVTYLWSTQRYALGVAAFVVAAATMEVLPVLLAFLALLLGAERLRPHLRELRGRNWGATLRDRDLWAAGALLLGSVVAYYLLLELRTDLLAAWFGFPAYPVAPVGYVIGGTPSGLQLSVSSLSLLFPQKIFYWLVLFTLVGFLPALRPRALLLVAPWVLFTVFIADGNYTILGFQYGLVAAGPMFAAAAWGLPYLPWPSAAPEPAPARPLRRYRWMRPRPMALAAIALVAINLSLTPFAGLVGNTGPGLNYSIGQAWPPAAQGAFSLAGLVPPRAPVLASDLLFPLVANDPNAYSLIWLPDPTLLLPFNGTDLPEYVLIAEDRLGGIPPWLVATIYNRSDFGVRGVAWGTPDGTALLFEAGYSGPLASFGTAPPSAEAIGAEELTIPAGEAENVSDPSSPGGLAIASLPYAVGLLWDGPHSDLAPGQYDLTLWVRASPTIAGEVPAPDIPVFTFVADEFAQPDWLYDTVEYGAIAGTGFTALQFMLNVTAPSLSVAFPGYALDPSAGIELEAIDLAPAG